MIDLTEYEYIYHCYGNPEDIEAVVTYLELNAYHIVLIDETDIYAWETETGYIETILEEHEIEYRVEENRKRKEREEQEQEEDGFILKLGR